MATNTEKEIVNIINNAIEENTFSLKAVEAIKGLRDLTEKQSAELRYKEETLSGLEDALKEREKSIAKLEKKLESMSKEILDYERREESILNKELEHCKLQGRVETANAVSNALKEVVSLVFKSPVYTKSVTESGCDSSYVNGVSNNVSVSRTKTETTSVN